MRRNDPRTSAEFSDPDTPLVLGGDNGGIISTQTESQFESDELEARKRKYAHLRLLWDQRRFLGRVAGLALVISTVIVFLIPKHFQSTARLMPPENQSGSGLAMAAMALTGGATGSSSLGGLGSLGGLAGQLLGMKNTSDLLVGVLTSRTIADSLIQKFNLQKVYHDRRIEDARKDLADNTDISVDRKSQIVTVTVTDKNPYRARAMAEMYVDQLNGLLAKVSTSSARRERVFLEARLKGVSRDLETAEKQFSQFASKNSAIDIKEQGKAMVEAAATLQGELIAARSELEGLRQIYADGNVRVRSMEARVSELESQLNQIGGEDVNSASADPNSDHSLYPPIRELPLLGVTWADLYRQTKVQEAVFQMLTQEYELAKVEEAKEIPQVKVLDAPNLPQKKSFPPRTLLILLATALALAGGVTWVLGRARWEDTDPSDPGKLFAQEVFGTLKASLPWGSRNGCGGRPKARESGQEPEPT